MTGQTISRYRVLEKLGQGGMGVVYKAEDTRLERIVALKFLSPHLLGNDDVRKRFEREAKAAASLHHPNICPVHEIDEVDGKAFISMAYIEGESLDKKIARGPLKLDEALDIARQVAAGLEAAHEKGIFHRDIKPENLIVDAKDHVTIMDFGLAQLAEASRLTKKDETLGTIYYMSPEQAEGSGADHRTDIWALGVVLYEMVTGQHPFKGDYDQAILYSVLNEDPEPMTSLRTGVPIELEVFASKCLAKNAEERYHHIEELAADLKSVARRVQSGRSMIDRSISVGSEKADRALKARAQIAWATAAILTVALVVLVLVRPVAPPVPRTVSTILPPASATVVDLALSPDGRQLVMVVDGEMGNELWLRSLGDPNARQLPGTQGAQYPFWSPNSRSIGFFARDRLMRTSAEAGAPVMICEAREGRGGTWNDQGVILFGGRRGSVFRVSDSGGEPSAVTTRYESGQGPFTHRWPVFLPDGRRFLFHAGRLGTLDEPTDLLLGSLDSDQVDRVMSPSPGNVAPSSGRLLWASGQTLLSQSFDGRRLVGEHVALAQGVDSDPYFSRTFFSASSTGSLVFLGGDGGQRRLVRYSRTGDELEVVGTSQEYELPALSPDGKRLAVVAGRDPRSIWIYDLERNIGTLFGQTNQYREGPVWSPDGRQLAWTQVGDGKVLFYRAPVDSSETPRPIFDVVDIGGLSGGGRPLSWSSNGNLLLFHANLGSGSEYNLYTLALDEGHDSAVEATEYLATSADEREGVFSPDGDWVAYRSDESGSNEIYVARFPQSTDKVRVSPNGGFSPAWRADGRELFYWDAEGRVVAVTVAQAAEGGLTVGDSEVLFSPRNSRSSREAQGERFSVSPDGQSFIVAEPVESAAAPTVMLIQHWDADLTKQR